MRHNLATISQLEASLDSGREARLIVQHAGNCVFHQFLNILAVGRCHLAEPSFDLGREVDFHTSKVRS